VAQFPVFSIENGRLAVLLCILEASAEVVPMPVYAPWYDDIWVKGDDSMLS